MIFFPFHSNSDGKFHLTMTITLEFNDDHDGLEMEMSEKKYSDPNLNNPFKESQTYTQKLTRTTFAS